MFRLISRTLPRTANPFWLRTFSAQASEVDQLPKAVDTAGRYAYALYNAAKKSNSLDAVINDVSTMQNMVANNTTLNEFLINPSLPRTAKVEAITEIVNKSAFSNTFSNFLMVMSENGRTSEASKALASFQDIIGALKGEVVVKVTTTIPLSDWELALLKKKIKNRFFAGKPDAELTVETAIDEELLGGLTIQVGDRFMDLSTRTELRKLQEVIGQAL
eukprot:TRINITY_DN70664_c0_g1_i1.p1 TRINITY_DN70664_c0_g1~~TRINITY_DN70664_c0_g1_i1.p1  ORF type:complete len:218 (-),score=43.34 TRINITY_DN70664_c0_g1_i1:463-1116(-)